MAESNQICRPWKHALSLPCLDDYLAVADRRLVNVVGPPVVAAGPFNPARIFFIFFRLTGEGEELRCLPR